MSREPRDGRDLATSPLVAALLGACILGLLAALAFSYIGLQRVGDRLAVLEEYVEGRGDYRDAEADRLDHRIDEVVCDILAEFPAGNERADRLRARYDCPIPAQPAPTEEIP